MRDSESTSNRMILAGDPDVCTARWSNLNRARPTWVFQVSQANSKQLNDVVNRNRRFDDVEALKNLVRRRPPVTHHPPEGGAQDKWPSSFSSHGSIVMNALTRTSVQCPRSPFAATLTGNLTRPAATLKPLLGM